MRKLIYFLFVSVLLCSSAFGQIKIADKIDEYKPIIAEAEKDASIYIWHVRKPVIKVPVNNNKTLHMWAPPGKYNIELTVINVDWKSQKIEYNEYYAEFEVVAVEPGPDPGPGPGPGPGPTPSAFKTKVKEGLAKVDQAALSYKDKVAGVYADIAKEAEANPDSWDAATMVNEAKVRNATALPNSVLKGWAGFWPVLAEAFKNLGLKSTDLKGHIQAFKDVAEVLTQ